ncbi:hypothetical protein [Bradyrhizobium sp.]|nr:hypothetical protein [Bradyrhizobium sp.]
MASFMPHPEKLCQSANEWHGRSLLRNNRERASRWAKAILQVKKVPLR